MEVSRERRFWPYDEVQFSGDFPVGKLKIMTPWMDLSLGLAEAEVPAIQSAVESFQAGELDEETCFQIQRLCASLSHLPFAYILPRENQEESNRVRLTPRARTTLALQNLHSPAELLTLVSEESQSIYSFNLSQAEQEAILTLSERAEFKKPWTWDHEAALQFATGAGGYDSEALFSVMKRFHLLDSVENNKTEVLYAKLQAMSQDPQLEETRARLLKTIVRQNHYVTQRCDSSLRPALALSKDAESSIAQFMRDESGHDKILGRALNELGVRDPDHVAVLPSSRALMAVFRRVSNSNLLAFSVVVDMFERSSYQDKDPLAQVLELSGREGERAGEFIDQHRQINDGGHHEEIALEFLRDCPVVSKAQASEALVWGELVTRLLHEIPVDLLNVE